MVSCGSGLSPQPTHLRPPTRQFEEFDFSSASNACVATSKAAFLTSLLATEVSCLDDDERFEVNSDVAEDNDDEADGYESDPAYAPASYLGSSSSSSSDGEMLTSSSF